VQKRLNLSICRFHCGLEWAEGCIGSIVFARWRQCALVEGHVAVTCRITLNHPSTAAMRLMTNYFDHLLSLDTPTYKPSASSRVLYCGHSTQYSHLVHFVHTLAVRTYTRSYFGRLLTLVDQSRRKIVCRHWPALTTSWLR